MLSENEVKAAVQQIISGTAAWTSFQDSLSHVTYLFSEWRISDENAQNTTKRSS